MGGYPLDLPRRSGLGPDRLCGGGAGTVTETGTTTFPVEAFCP
jgi:hypothetical protein